ncbi:MAG: ABC transporter permease [Anaerolineae bacterium]
MTTGSTRRTRRTLRERLFGNPMVIKELRGRMRGARAFIVLTVYLALMSGFVTLIYVVFAQSLALTGPSQGGEIGRVLFRSIVGVELFLVTFIAPAFAAGAISGERERQTYDLLRTTLLPARSLVGGKLLATLSYIFLLLLAAIPLQSIAFLFGGVSGTEVVLSFVILLSTAVLLGTVGVFFSALTRRTLSASVLSYAFAVLSIVVLPVGLLIVLPVLNGLLPTVTDAVETGLYYVLGLMIATNPMGTLFGTLILLSDRQVAWTFPVTLTSGATITLISPWIVFVVFTLIVSIILIVIAVRRVDRIEDM